MSFINEKIAQQKLIKVLNTFKSVIECQDKQIKDLYDRINKIEKILDFNNYLKNATSNNKGS